MNSRGLLGVARAQYAARDIDAASQVVRRIVTSHHAPPVPVLIEALLLTAEIAATQGQETTAVEAATTAVQLAAAEQMVLPFIPAGPRLHPLLHRHPALINLWPAPLDDAPARWARELPTDREHKQLAETLTEREISILNWLTTTMTMAEIAAELTSPPTPSRPTSPPSTANSKPPTAAKPSSAAANSTSSNPHPGPPNARRSRCRER